MQGSYQTVLTLGMVLGVLYAVLVPFLPRLGWPWVFLLFSWGLFGALRILEDGIRNRRHLRALVGCVVAVFIGGMHLMFIMIDAAPYQRICP